MFRPQINPLLLNKPKNVKRYEKIQLGTSQTKTLKECIPDVLWWTRLLNEYVDCGFLVGGSGSGGGMAATRLCMPRPRKAKSEVFYPVVWLFVFSPSENGQPKDVAKSLVPTWNSVSWFEVTEASHHQVRLILRQGLIWDELLISGLLLW